MLLSNHSLSVELNTFIWYASKILLYFRTFFDIFIFIHLYLFISNTFTSVQLFPRANCYINDAIDWKKWLNCMIVPYIVKLHVSVVKSLSSFKITSFFDKNVRKFFIVLWKRISNIHCGVIVTHFSSFYGISNEFSSKTVKSILGKICLIYKAKSVHS